MEDSNPPLKWEYPFHATCLPMWNNKPRLLIHHTLLCPEREEKHCFATLDKASIDFPCFTDQSKMKFSTVRFQAELPASMHRRKATFWNFYPLYISQKPFISSSFMLSIWIPSSLSPSASGFFWMNLMMVTLWLHWKIWNLLRSSKILQRSL